MHIDHTGWNTIQRDGRWVPTFPNARYVFHRAEYDYWRAMTASGASPSKVWSTNCLPVLEAGQALLVDDGYQLDDTFSLTPSPGHSPHHCCIEIHSRGHHAIVTGDLMHHALQCPEPDWSTIFDTDAVQAARSRRAFLDAFAETATLILPIHFPNPTVGRITAAGSRFHYRFLR